MRIGIVAVHGVIPQLRFGFQDEVAAQLTEALNAPSQEPAWTWTVVLPSNGAANAANVPTISRVHQVHDDPAHPASDFFDVHEAFWSPIDKGKTTFASICAWLLKTVFAPLNSFARYREHPLKVCWDLGYVLLAFAIAVFLLLFAAMQSANGMLYVLCQVQVPHAAALKDFAAMRCPAVWAHGFDWSVLFGMASLLLNPLEFAKLIGPGVIAGLVFGLIGTYLWWQAIRSLWFLVKGIVQGRGDVLAVVSRLVAIALLTAAGGILVYFEWHTPVAGSALRSTGLLMIVSIAAFDFGRSYLAWFVTNFFGDVQIYTTNNQNSEFYALREAILQKVEDVIVNVAAKSPAGAPYDRVYVLAHSLGSTIAMDALIRLYDVVKAPVPPLGVAPTLGWSDWLRIRGFVTFGTALEKTKYFFNAWSATPSQGWEQWNDDIYGGLFTADRSSLDSPDASFGIYWLNSWFFSDFVSDEITTYRSFLLPGETLADAVNARDDARALAASGQAVLARCVADNRHRFGPWPRHIETHTWYLEHPWFWHASTRTDFATLDVLTSGTPLARKAVRAARAPAMPSRGHAVGRWEAATFKQWHVER